MTNYISGPIYKMILNLYTKEIQYILRLTDNTFIPLDPANSDYQEYLKWVKAGNVAQLPDLT